MPLSRNYPRFPGRNTHKNTSAIALFMLNDYSEGLRLTLWVTLLKRQRVRNREKEREKERERCIFQDVHTCIHTVCFISVLCAGSVSNAKPACVSF